MVQALLCDIDGTLVQSNWLHAQAWQAAFRELGLELDVEDLRRQIGKGGDQLIPVYVPWWKRKQIEEPLKQLRKFIFQTEFMPQVKPLPGVREFALRLRRAGIKMALATSADQEDLLIYKRLVKIEDLVEEEASAADAQRSKPHPDIFEAALARLKLKPADALALGDTPYDAEAAGRAGVWTIGVETGGWSSADLFAAGCIEVYKDVGELLERFDQSALNRP